MTAAVISFINLKGGVGKSTLTMLLGECLAFRFGKDVLFIDMDAQGVSEKFPSFYHKYALSYALANPKEGLLSRAEEEGPSFRLEERIERLAQEIVERCG